MPTLWTTRSAEPGPPRRRPDGLVREGWGHSGGNGRGTPNAAGSWAGSRNERARILSEISAGRSDRLAQRRHDPLDVPGLQRRVQGQRQLARAEPLRVRQGNGSVGAAVVLELVDGREVHAG